MKSRSAPRHRTRRAHWALWTRTALLLLALTAVAACSSTSRPPADSSTASELQPRAKNAPALCAQLAGNQSIRQLGTNVPRLIAGTSREVAPI